MESSKLSQQWKQILEIDPVAVHELNNGWKKFKDIGNLRVYQKPDGTYWASVNHGTKHQLFKDSTIYKLGYSHYTSYMREAIKGGFVVLSLQNNSPKLREWEELVRKFGKIEDFGKGLQCVQFQKKIEFHCPDVEKTSVHNQNMMTPIYMWGGNMKDMVCEKSQKVFEGGSNREGYAQKTKRLWRNTWKAFTTKVMETKDAIAEKMHKGDDNLPVQENLQNPSGESRRSKKHKQGKQVVDTS